MTYAAQRPLGQEGPLVSALGLGCFAIGGTALRDGREHGWTGVDDAASIRAIHAALDHGITFFDTADVYGAGRSERVVGQALRGRQDVVIASKFGKLFDEETRTRFDESRTDVSPAYLVAAIEGSLRRLGRDRLDLWQLHDSKLDLARLPDMVGALADLHRAGKLGAVGWSTDDAARAAAMADACDAAGVPFRAVQLRLNVLEPNEALVALCEARGIAAVCRSPMAQGLLTGKYRPDSAFDAADLRQKWNLRSGREATRLAEAEALRAVLCTGGRSMVQGALGWLMAASPAAIPIAGFKSEAQVADIAGALTHGPLPPAVMAEVAAVLARTRAA